MKKVSCALNDRIPPSIRHRDTMLLLLFVMKMNRVKLNLTAILCKIDTHIRIFQFPFKIKIL